MSIFTSNKMHCLEFFYITKNKEIFDRSTKYLNPFFEGEPMRIEKSRDSINLDFDNAFKEESVLSKEFKVF